ncbi:meiotic recombination protein REC8 homolog [Oryzias latipes]|uniref:REC8 meiotic recombination protein b n=1 Tax=Oryzias latipes TaxID=8090 RepID=A0A3B3I174_ORYLA|nr:meiotic recombination protein REC8 homolog [Oryzias latipes]
MFYYPNVLQRHTGCFSTVWLAATRGIQVHRKELVKVNVKRTCGAILDYITAQVPPPQPNQPRPRFSLYLSSQLQYGVVVVYYKQCGFLLEEIQQTIHRLLRCKRHVRIDMEEPERMLMDVPDSLEMLVETDGAQDPFFGVLESYHIPSPNEIYQADFVIADRDVQDSLKRSRNSAPNNGFSSPPAAITLTEKEPFVINTAEYFEGDDLPEATAKDIELLMEQPDLFWKEAERQQTEDLVKDQGTVSSIDQLKETTLGGEQDSVWLPDEDADRPVGLLAAAAALEMTPQHVAMPTPSRRASESLGDEPAGILDAEMAVPPRRQRERRRQLVFADVQVQLSHSAMQEQIGNPQTGTLNLAEVILGSVINCDTPAQLFVAPCGALLHPDLLSLWKQQASLSVLPGERQSGEEEAMEILRAERKRRHSYMKELSGVSGIQLSDASSVSDVIHDLSKENRSSSDVLTPASRWSLQEELQLPMEPIMEENIKMPEVPDDIEDGNMSSWIYSTIQGLGQVTFDSLLPPEADRFIAAQTLNKLLELLSDQQVTASQSEPYADIVINQAELRTSA